MTRAHLAHAFREMGESKFYLLKTLIKRNLSTWYGGSIMGLFWAVINPLLTIGLYLMVFRVFLKLRLDKTLHGTEDFSLWLVIGLLPWLFFSESVGSGAYSIRNNGYILKKMRFPSEVFPIAYVCSAFIAHIVYLGIVAIICWGLHGLTYKVAYLLFFVPMLFTLSLSLALLTSALSVYIKDLTLLLPVLLQTWFFITPIVYPHELVPKGILRTLVDLNPMRWIVEGYRGALLGYSSIEVPKTIAIALSVTFLFLISSKAFDQLKRGFADVL